MQDIHESSVTDLVYSLQKQFPDGMATFSTCPLCETHPARGGAACTECLRAELISRTGAAELVDELCGLLEQRQKANMAIAETLTQIFSRAASAGAARLATPTNPQAHGENHGGY